MSNYGEYRTRVLRLTLLKSLSAAPGYRANEDILQEEAGAVGIEVSRAVIRSELTFLSEIGAITVKAVGSVMVATITLRGKEHVEGLTRLEGVNTPSPEA